MKDITRCRDATFFTFEKSIEVEGVGKCSIGKHFSKTNYPARSNMGYREQSILLDGYFGRQFAFTNISFGTIPVEITIGANVWMTNCVIDNEVVVREGSSLNCVGCHFSICNSSASSSIRASGPCDLSVVNSTFKGNGDNYDNTPAPCIALFRSYEMKLKLVGNRFIDANTNLLGDDEESLLTVNHDNTILSNNTSNAKDVLDLFVRRLEDGWHINYQD